MSQPLLPNSLLRQLGKPQTAPVPQQAEPVDRHALVGIVLCVTLVLLAVLGPFIAQITSDGAEEGSSFRQISYLLLWGAVITWSMPWRRGWKNLMISWPMALALAWCWASVTWAVEPGIAMRRLALTTTVVWTVFILVRSGGYRRTVDALRIAMAITLALNYLTVWIKPEVGIHLGMDNWMSTALAGNWRGITTHKNFAGAACAICILLFVFDARHINWRLRLAVLLPASYFLDRSVSKTSIGMVVLSALIGYGYNAIAPKYRVFLVPTAMLVICAVATYTSTYIDVLSHNLLEPTAFTGRGQIWSALMLYVQDHPMLGAGFGSFWNVGESSPIFTYGHGYVTTVTVGHNGYLDLMVTLGVPGLCLAIFAVLLWPLFQVVSSRSISTEKGALLCALILFAMGHNVTESSLLERDALTGVFAVFVAAFASYSLSTGRSRRKKSSSSQKAGQAVMDELKQRSSKMARAPLPEA